MIEEQATAEEGYLPPVEEFTLEGITKVEPIVDEADGVLEFYIVNDDIRVFVRDHLEQVAIVEQWLEANH